MTEKIEKAETTETATNRFGWNPKIGDRVEGVAGDPPHGTGHFGTVVDRKRWGYVVEWENGGRKSVQSYGLRPAEKAETTEQYLARVTNQIEIEIERVGHTGRAFRLTVTETRFPSPRVVEVRTRSPRRYVVAHIRNGSVLRRTDRIDAARAAVRQAGAMNACIIDAVEGRVVR